MNDRALIHTASLRACDVAARRMRTGAGRHGGLAAVRRTLGADAPGAVPREWSAG